MTISVGAVGGDEMHAYYSTTGASLFISAPGGDVDDDLRHVTAQRGGGCVRTSVGTSFAAPLVSGVVAMVLEVNPNLEWRDVQGILADSARPVTNDPLDDTATFNGAERWVSNLYGFGIIDAAAAIDLARSWINFEPEKLITLDSGILDYTIYDNPETEITTTIVVKPTLEVASVQRQASSDFVVEAVEVLLGISHFSRGDLEIRLVSPSGTESRLHPGSLPENTQLGSDQLWKLMTVRNWGESPYGEWKLILLDEKTGELNSCVDAAGYRIVYGNGTLLTCFDIERAGICTNAGYNTTFFDSGSYDSLKLLVNEGGLTIEDACCACGGGLGRDAFQDTLHHWTIAIYGREIATEKKIATSNPSLSPTLIPSMSPSSALPTERASDIPTSVASLMPSLSPSSIPTTEPSTASPTASPLDLSTVKPSTIPRTASPTFTASERPIQVPSTTPSSTPSVVPSIGANITSQPGSSGNSEFVSNGPSDANSTINDLSSSPSSATASNISSEEANSGNGTTGFTPDASQRISSPSPTPSLGVNTQENYSMRGSSGSSTYLHQIARWPGYVGLLLLVLGSNML